jgi:hypothetical protein
MKVKVDEIYLLGSWKGEFKIKLRLSVSEEDTLDFIDIKDGDYLNIIIPDEERSLDI